MRGQAARLRPLAPARQSSAGRGTTCCPISSARRTISAGTSCTAPAASGASTGERLSWAILDAFREAAAEIRHPEDGRLQPRQQRGLRLFPGEPAPRHPLDHRQGFPAAGGEPPEPRGRHAGAGHRPGLEGRRCTRRRASAGRRRRQASARRREVILAAGADRLAAPPAALGHRPGGAPPRAWDRGAARAAGRRPRTCRTICRSAWSTRSRACGR